MKKIIFMLLLLSGCGLAHRFYNAAKINARNYNEYSRTKVGQYYLYETKDSVFLMKKTAEGYEIRGSTKVNRNIDKEL
jgi:hypothetical protein